MAGSRGEMLREQRQPYLGLLLAGQGLKLQPERNYAAATAARNLPFLILFS